GPAPPNACRFCSKAASEMLGCYSTAGRFVCSKQELGGRSTTPERGAPVVQSLAAAWRPRSVGVVPSLEGVYRRVNGAPQRVTTIVRRDRPNVAGDPLLLGATLGIRALRIRERETVGPAAEGRRELELQGIILPEADWADRV